VTTQLTAALSAEDIIELSRIVRRVPVADHLARYAIQFARRTRVGYGDVPEIVRANVSWGAGPRASQYLILAAKARAVLNGRYYVSADDIRAVAPPVLRHRIVTNFNAEAEGIKPDDIVAHLVKSIPLSDHAA
jgi:MoxR-like ATPase